MTHASEIQYEDGVGTLTTTINYIWKVIILPNIVLEYLMEQGGRVFALFAEGTTKRSSFDYFRALQTPF